MHAAFLMALPGALPGAETNLFTSPVISPASAGGGWWDFVRLLGYGLVLVAGAWWASRGLKRWPGLQRLVQAQGQLRVLESRPLGFRCHVHLVACGEQRFLVGSSPTGVTLVSELVETAVSAGGAGFHLPGGGMPPRPDVPGA